MSCGGGMMRSSHQPLAHLVDAAAEKWLAVEGAPKKQQRSVTDEIISSFNIGDRPELTFHGQKYLLTISRDEGGPDDRPEAFSVEVHEIKLDG